MKPSLSETHWWPHIVQVPYRNLIASHKSPTEWIVGWEWLFNGKLMQSRWDEFDELCARFTLITIYWLLFPMPPTMMCFNAAVLLFSTIFHCTSIAFHMGQRLIDRQRASSPRLSALCFLVVVYTRTARDDVVKQAWALILCVFSHYNNRIKMSKTHDSERRAIEFLSLPDDDDCDCVGRRIRLSLARVINCVTNDRLVSIWEGA